MALTVLVQSWWILSMDSDTLRIVWVCFSYLWVFPPQAPGSAAASRCPDLEADEGTPAHSLHTEF